MSLVGGGGGMKSPTCEARRRHRCALGFWGSHGVEDPVTRLSSSRNGPRTGGARAMMHGCHPPLASPGKRRPSETRFPVPTTPSADGRRAGHHPPRQASQARPGIPSAGSRGYLPPETTKLDIKARIGTRCIPSPYTTRPQIRRYYTRCPAPASHAPIQ